MRTQPKRRLYYPAGLISLVLLPALCIGYLFLNHVFDKFVVFEVNWWNPQEYGQYVPDNFVKEANPDKHFYDVNLTGDNQADKVKLKHAQKAIHELVQSQDTSTIVHFHFSKTARYWTFVEALDICQIEKAMFYIPYKNDLWVLNPEPASTKEKKEQMVGPNCGTSAMRDYEIITREKEEEQTEKMWRFLTESKWHILPALLFLGMVVFSHRKIHKSK